MALEQALRDEREITRVLLLDALPGLDGADVIARGGRDVAQDDVGADALAVRGEGRLEAVPRPVRTRMRHFRQRQLAVVIRDFFLRGLPGVLLQLEGDPDRLHPVLFLLVDLEQEFQRLGAMRRALELEEHLFRAIEKPGLEVVLTELDHRVQPLLAPRSGRSSRFRCMRIARSVSPRRRNRLPSAKCSSTVCGSTLTTSMKASIALSGCSLSRKLRPLKYERGSCRDSERSCLISMRAASQPSPKNRANPNSHQSSNSIESCA